MSLSRNNDQKSECIYNILEKSRKKKQEGRYKSKYPPNLAPTGSTFINRNTTRPGVANLAGEYNLFKGGHDYQFPSLTLGHPKGCVEPQMAHDNPNQLKAFKIKSPEEIRKPPVPAHKIGQKNVKSAKNFVMEKSAKNFIMSNAIDAALMRAEIPKPPRPFTARKDYGRVPKYLQTVKDDIEKEYRVYQRNMRIQRGQPPDEDNLSRQPLKAELLETRELLKAKWDQIHDEYLKMAHKSKIDTLIQTNKKLELERQMNALEQQIRNLRIQIQNSVK